MTHYPVPTKNRSNARKMRKVMTDAELKLWNEIRAHRLMGLAFRRQMPIELDGSQHAHAEASASDAARTAKFEALGWTILRFWNDDVIRDIDNVCQHIVIEAGLSGAEMPAREPARESVP